MNDIFSVKNKIIVITGAGRGIGRFLANELSKRSAIVYAVDKTFSKKNQTNDYFQKNEEPILSTIGKAKPEQKIENNKISKEDISCSCK